MENRDGIREGKRDVFPTTLNTWIGRKLQEGNTGRAQINRHVMEVYFWPLQVYYSGLPYRWLGEAIDVVHGFFADRLDRPDFFADWQQSGLRLRRWLMNGFIFFIKEQLRERRRDSQNEPLYEEHKVDSTKVDEEIDRAFAISIVRLALRKTEEVCASKGLSQHWQVFQRHYYGGEEYQDFAAELGIDTVRASTMSRTVAGKFRSALRELLAWDGASEQEINRELACLLEVAK